MKPENWIAIINQVIASSTILAGIWLSAKTQRAVTTPRTNEQLQVTQKSIRSPKSEPVRKALTPLAIVCMAFELLYPAPVTRLTVFNMVMCAGLVAVNTAVGILRTLQETNDIITELLVHSNPPAAIPSDHKQKGG